MLPKVRVIVQSTIIMLRRSSQCDTSVMRVRVIKNPLQICSSPLQICTSPLQIYISGSANTHHFHNGLVHIPNEFFMTLKSDSHC